VHPPVCALLVSSAKPQLSNHSQSLSILLVEDGANVHVVPTAPSEQRIHSSVQLAHSLRLNNLAPFHSALRAQLALTAKSLVSLPQLGFAILATTVQQHQQLVKQLRDQKPTNALQVIIVFQVLRPNSNVQPVPINIKKDNQHV
jgi:hypothetical protein